MSEQKSKSTLLNQRFIDTDLFRNAQSIALFWSIPPEPNLSLIIEVAQKSEKTLFLPSYDDRSEKYRFVVWEHNMPLEKGPYNIPQPAPNDSAKAAMDLTLVPGLAFDDLGNRLGHGAGIYDRLLAEETATRIGVAFDYQRVPELPTELHDCAMDYLLTESKLISL